MSGIRKKFLFQLLYAFSQLAFPLLTYPYITRQLGAGGLGLIGYVEYVAGFIITIASFGIPFFGVREIARVQDDKEKKAAILRNLLSLHLLVSLIGCAVFVLLIKANQQQSIPHSLLLLGCINILLPAFIAEWYMQGIEAFAFTTVRSIVLRFLGLVAMFTLVNEQDDFVVYYLIIVLVQTAVALSNMYKIGWKGFLPKMGSGITSINTLWRFFLTSSIISVYVFFDVLVLGWMAKEAQVGYYTVAVRIVKLSLLVVLSLNVIMFPRISFLKSNAADDQDVVAFIQKSLQFMVILTIPIATGFYLLAPSIVSILAGSQFLPSVLLVQILSVLPFIIGFSNLFVYQVLTPFGKEKQLLTAVLITCILSLTLHLLFSKWWAEKGTALATVLTELIMTGLTAFFAFRTIHLQFPVTTLLQTVLAVVPFILVSLAGRMYFENPWMLLLVCGSVGLLLYVLLQFFLFRNALLWQVWADVKQFKRGRSHA